MGDLEPILRSILLTKDPKTAGLFRISVIGLKQLNGSLINFISEPDMRMTGKSHFAHFIINGLIYCIELDSRNELSLFQDYPLFVGEEMQIPFISGNTASKLLVAFGLPVTFVDSFTR
ncbi:hypothetical protein [Niabella beijingensis]|uniref:hypothetical protein n=1 Tax=Niabella beijingensis TaxID=2872700 RepID=UPI001CBBE924|nr:hypothetical protein [Niabella beijingensis]MBZ4190735.1 hypothetical protein [Niabella beijingensis]